MTPLKRKIMLRGSSVRKFLKYEISCQVSQCGLVIQHILTVRIGSQRYGLRSLPNRAGFDQYSQRSASTASPAITLLCLVEDDIAAICYRTCCCARVENFRSTARRARFVCRAQHHERPIRCSCREGKPSISNYPQHRSFVCLIQSLPDHYLSVSFHVVARRGVPRMAVVTDGREGDARGAVARGRVVL
jgi:hypothetical protein